MAATAQVQEMAAANAQALLRTTGAQLVRQTATMKTFVAQKTNQTFILSAGAKPGTVKVQIMSGCAC